ncbi:MAG: ornithine carbamoyltransferase [Candidatus Sumerlaeaceae bacterium]
MTRDFVKSSDFDADTINRLFALSAKMKAGVKRREFLDVLKGYNVALLFQKPSLRTRVTFDVGVHQLGGHTVYLGPTEISMGVRESVYDVARNLERWVDLVVARVFAQAHVEELAQVAEPPVINALSDDEHPCQALADFFTLYEKGVKWSELKLAYVGDGNNVCTSLMVTAATLGAEMRVASPEKYAPSRKMIDLAARLNSISGGKFLLTSDPVEAVEGAAAVYTDIWASMGRENEAAERAKVFRPYQLNDALLKKAAPGAFAMHDLPAHRGEEITDEVMDSPTSIVFDQAENRLHIQKAIMLECLGKAENV